MCHANCFWKKSASRTTWHIPPKEATGNVNSATQTTNNIQKVWLAHQGDLSCNPAKKGFEPESPVATCAEILDDTPNAPSGAYFITTEEGGCSRHGCHMDAIAGCGEGPWTLVMKISGYQGRIQERVWGEKGWLLANF
ncbi:hypothetical protein OS493_025641 [Desmophyllum pertusum]|uniref:Uncharacterized protein n=1 Tax=Desmophyllum pertusum TaxID=174260 RepID=A0A9X0D9B3_9CNID|nr:hypothetical protein OS493_025641 [Desmophyllum pertusum]